MHSPSEEPSTRPTASRLVKAVLVAIMVIASISVIFALATEGLGKSAVAPMLVLITGVVLSFRIWGPSARN
jgi:hypothetical protein